VGVVQEAVADGVRERRVRQVVVPLGRRELARDHGGAHDEGRGPQGALTTDEKAELAALRKENRVLKMERDLLKKAAAFFAKENS
jgi:transposase-like protein